MLRFVSYDVVFQEIPGEVTLAVNISGCPHRCPACHSPHLRQDIGQPLNEHTMSMLLDRYGTSVTCICLMGGDASPDEVAHLAAFVRRGAPHKLKTAWYSGLERLPENFDPCVFDYIKLGPYVQRLGGLDSPQTNQRLYRIENGVMIDTTSLFLKRTEMSCPDPDAD